MVIKRDSQNYISLDNLRTHSSTWSSDVHSPEEPTKTENVEPPHDEKLSSNRPWWATIATQIFALAWIAPMLTLLVLNLKGYVIGPTAWCPSRHCYAETFAFNTLAHQEKLRKFNHNDHNLLGALQLVAKALEVWFEVIAGLLVYLITLQIASQKEGIAIGYLMTPFEFSRLPALFDLLLWKIAPGLGKARSKSVRIYRRRIYLLLLLIISLCALCNLMGPATAVLVLPTLQWIDTANVGNSSFVEMNAANPPQAGNWFIQTSNCTGNDAQAFNYSCAAPTFGSALDVWLESISNTAPGVTQQDQLTFNINTTYSISTDGPLTARYNSSLYWAPNREIVSNLSADFLAVGLLSLGVDEKTWEQNVGSLDSYNSYAEYNSSLNLAILRNWPILGAIVNNWISFDDASVTVVEVAPNQQIRCYDSYNLDSFDGTSSGNYTKCIQTGTGWGPSNKMANFSVAGMYDYATRVVRPDTQISIFSSEKAAFLENGILPDWLPGDCLRNGTVPANTNCDYNRLFTTDPSSPVANRSSNVNTMEMTTRQNATSVTAAIDFVAFLGFTTYTLDASPITNPSQVIQTEDIDNTQTSITIDPSWTLAAFSANAGSIQSPDHSTSQQLSNLMSTFLSLAQQPNPSTNLLSDTDQNNYYYLTMISIAQTLSIIDIHTTPSTPSSSTITTQTHPLLHRSARMNVWAYSASSSRTAILGTVVAIIGIVVTLIQFVVSLWDQRPFRSSTQLLVAALEHVPRDEFRGRETSEEGVARVRFHVREALEGVGVSEGGGGGGMKGNGDADGNGGLVGRIRFHRTEG